MDTADRALHPDDIVAKKANLKALAVVERTDVDIDTHIPYPARTDDDPIVRDKGIPNAAFQKFLIDGIPPRGSVLVRWRDIASLELLPTSKIILVDRSLLIGDIVKRRISDAMSGCVLNTFTKCTLQPICDITYQNSQTYKGLLPPGQWNPGTSQFCVYPNGRTPELVNVPAAELVHSEPFTEDDVIIYQDWIGRVEVMTTFICVRLSNNTVVEIGDEEGEHPDGSPNGFFVGDLVKTKKGVLRTGKWVFGHYNPNTPPIGTVVSIRPVSAEITWLEKRIGSLVDNEPPVILEADELESAAFRVYDRTRRPNGLTAVEQTISNSKLDVRLNLRVRFRDVTGACLKYGMTKLNRAEYLGYDINVLDVVTFHTEVTIQWQDLSITTERSRDLVPDTSIDDEHAAWPGEIAHTLKLNATQGMENIVQPERVGVVQSVNAEARMAHVKWSPDSVIRYSKDPDGENLEMLPMIEHRISSMSLTEEEISLYDIEAPAAMNVRRGDLVFITDPDYNKVVPAETTWLGEIVDTRLDGKLVVRLGAASEVRDIVLSREQTIVAVRSDGTDEIYDWADGDEDSDDLIDGISIEDESDEEWENDLEMLEEENAHYEDENGMTLDEEDVENGDWESAEEGNDDVEMSNAMEDQVRHDDSEEIDSRTSDIPAMPLVTVKQDIKQGPEAYMVLEGAVPLDHRYHKEPPTSTSVHSKRTQKEHKILRNPSTLPGGVYIRTWESRLDLLRVLLVGPQETPYANAPFIIDFYLPPTFPQDPPQAHFHSWPPQSSIGALGRVGPNLYEDGKICLSLLGTWEGAKGESWSPSRSTLLQIIVSLQGLVLVREPYFNEAGYEALVGSEASKRPSALYSERIFLRAKGCLITALSGTDSTPGLQGVGDVVAWLYSDPSGPRLLQSTIREVGEVLERSHGGREPDGLTVMSKGAAISAKRLFDRLQELEAAVE